MAHNLPMEVVEYLSAFRYKIELHAHTSPVSSCSQLPPEKLIDRLAAKGYDEVVITNHFTPDGGFNWTDDPVGTYLADYYAACEAGEKRGVKVLLGAEYRFKENSNDYLVYGVDEAFLRETVKRLDMTFAQFYEEYHSEKLLILQAHPFRSGIVQAAPDHLDGIESFNMHPHHNSRVAMASRWAKDNNLPVMTIGTDLHNPGYEGLCATRTRTLPTTSEELIAILRAQDYIMDIAGSALLPFFDF